MLKILAPVFWTTTKGITTSLGRSVPSSWPKIPQVILTQLLLTHHPRWSLHLAREGGDNRCVTWREEVIPRNASGRVIYRLPHFFMWSSREFLVCYCLFFFLYSKKKKKKGYLDSKSRGLKSSLKSIEMTLRKFCSRLFEPTQSAIIS